MDIIMKLRMLEMKDAVNMLEWMHDENVVGELHTNFAEKTLEDCQNFIKVSKQSQENMHMAIVDDDDIYMGTVSLKHINKNKGIAEFAITVRRKAMAHGYAAFGMTEILKKGFGELGLRNIYWCVSKKNVRAVRFYDKNGYKRTKSVPECMLNLYKPENENMYWYVKQSENMNR